MRRSSMRHSPLFAALLLALCATAAEASLVVVATSNITVSRPSTAASTSLPTPPTYLQRDMKVVTEARTTPPVSSSRRRHSRRPAGSRRGCGPCVAVCRKPGKPPIQVSAGAILAP
ncbi:hypothetical protein ACPA9J_25290 [Pseudomonas aeruginosa]